MPPPSQPAQAGALVTLEAGEDHTEDGPVGGLDAHTSVTEQTLEDRDGPARRTDCAEKNR